MEVNGNFTKNKVGFPPKADPPAAGQTPSGPQPRDHQLPRRKTGWFGFSGLFSLGLLV